MIYIIIVIFHRINLIIAFKKCQEGEREGEEGGGDNISKLRLKNVLKNKVFFLILTVINKLIFQSYIAFQI